MKYIIFFITICSTIFSLTNEQIKQNCCTLYDDYANGTQISIGSKNTNIYYQEPTLTMPASQASSMSGFCDSENKVLYSWEDGVPLENDTDIEYTKVAYTYSCSTCNISESDFPDFYQGYNKQSIELSAQMCLAKIYNYSPTQSGTVYAPDETLCPNMFGCYYNTTSDNNTTDPIDNNITNPTDNIDTTIPDSLSTIENKLGNIESDTLRTANSIEDLNSKFELDTNSDFSSQVTENANAFSESLNILSSNYATVSESFDNLKEYVADNPFTYKNIDLSTSCDYHFDVFNKMITVNMCQYSYIFAPVVVFFLNITFMYSLLRLNFYFYNLVFGSSQT